MKRKVTIRDVAVMAQISNQPASCVSNNRPDADKERQRVCRVTENLGYQSGALARSLIQQRSHTLGFITTGLQFRDPPQILNGIAKHAEEMGCAPFAKNFPTFAAAIPNLPSTYCVQGRLKVLSGPFQRSATVETRSGINFLKYLSPPFISPSMQTLPSVSAAAVDNSVAGWAPNT